MAGKLALNTLGARSVDNQLVLRPERPSVVQSIGGDIADGWISMKVKSTLMYSNNVSGLDISVCASGGVVQLTGKVNSEVVGALAVELAGNVRGVKSVDSSALTMI
jgi:osmotically-inducible protein OsmY